MRKALPLLGASPHVLVLALVAGPLSCAGPRGSEPATGDAAPAAACPRVLPAPHVLPGARPEHRQAGYWISRTEAVDEPVLTGAEIAELNRRARSLSSKDGGLGARADLLSGPVDPAPVVRAMEEALGRHRERAASGGRVLLEGERPPEDFWTELSRIQRGASAADELRIAVALTPLRSHPSDRGLFEEAGDVDFDMFQSATAHPGELLRLVSRHPEGWTLVRSAYAFGWVREETLGPVLAEERARAYLGSQQYVTVLDDRVPVWSSPERTEQQAAVDLGLRLPLLGRDPSGLVQVLAPAPEVGLAPGFVEPDDLAPGVLPMTRRNVIRHAFARLDDAFGWGGAGGDRDCSRFLMDLFALFGLELPRNSYWQSQAGTTAIDLAGLDATARAEQLDRALGQGVVLLYMPGHIMLLLGREGDDHYVIHQFSGYRVGCRPGTDVKMAVDRVSVTNLRLGEGSERRSFLERITSVVILG